MYESGAQNEALVEKKYGQKRGERRERGEGTGKRRAPLFGKINLCRSCAPRSLFLVLVLFMSCGLQHYKKRYPAVRRMFGVNVGCWISGGLGLFRVV